MIILEDRDISLPEAARDIQREISRLGFVRIRGVDLSDKNLGANTTYESKNLFFSFEIGKIEPNGVRASGDYTLHDLDLERLGEDFAGSKFFVKNIEKLPKNNDFESMKLIDLRKAEAGDFPGVAIKEVKWRDEVYLISFVVRRIDSSRLAELFSSPWVVSYYMYLTGKLMEYNCGFFSNMPGCINEYNILLKEYREFFLEMFIRASTVVVYAKQA